MKRLSLFPIPGILFFIVPLVFGVAFSALQYVQLFRTAENRWYDQLLHLRPEVEEHDDILLLNIDDRAVAAQGEWPWRRGVMAEGMLDLSEFGPSAIVLDIEYTDPGLLEVDGTRYSEEVPRTLEAELGTLRENAARVAEAMESGALDPASAPLYFADFADELESSRRQIEQELDAAVRDGDRFLSTALSLSGRVYLPLVLAGREDQTAGLDSPETARRFSIDVEGEVTATVPPVTEVRRIVEPVDDGVTGAGFANTQVDPDGVKRAIHLFLRRGERVLPQLVIPGYLDRAGVGRVEVSRREVAFHRGEGEGEGEVTRVPRLPDGRVLVNWPQKRFEDSFTQVSFAELIELREMEEDLLFNLRQMQQAGYFSYADGSIAPIDAWEQAQAVRRRAISERSSALFRESRELARVYRAAVGTFLSGDAEQAMLADADALLADGSLSEAERESVSEARSGVEEVFEKTRGIYDRVVAARDRLESLLEDRVVFVGLTATSTTDIGVIPFDEEYVNIGLHASLLNMLLQESFLDRIPRTYAAVLALIFALGVSLLVQGRKPASGIATGLAAVVAVVAAQIVLFVSTGLYLPIQPILLAMLFSFITLTVLAFVETERDKTWLHNAFEHYISAEFIQELVQDPEKLHLGGQERELTAMFTDVKQFTHISENLEPQRLVTLLNDYLSDMSDIILNERGTIDKFEGDAVVAFFGAPVDVPDHPRRACHAAVRMKKMEEVLNERFMREDLTPTPVLSRIGINTGQMLVGNLGTTRRMDYTILGHEANLASRLEGVNKQYGTWILLSERTYRRAGEGFLVRRLDRVRMVGIQQPVRLYELIGERSEETPMLKEALGLFEEGLAAFERRDWSTALRSFENVLRIYPGDGPASLFSGRCRTFIEREPSEQWDGVFNLNRK
jgi:adenylate cyclase